jgi:fatty acid-binding protein DegV
VLTITAGEMRVVGSAADVEQAAEVMATWIRGAGERLRVGLGVADAEAAPLSDAVEGKLAGAPEIAEVVRYRIGPSVGAHTGPGTVGAMYAPLSAAAIDPA